MAGNCFGAQVQPMCCNGIGYADDYDYMVGDPAQEFGQYCWTKTEVQTYISIKDRWTQLNNCKLLFDGLNDSCGNDTVKIMDPNARAYVKQWIIDGGRYYIAGEFQGCMGEEGKNKLNTWMIELGVSLRIGDPANVGCNNQCYTVPGGPRWKGTPNPAVDVMRGCNGIIHAATNFITGGTWLCKTQLPDATPGCSIATSFISCEKLGKGYVILAGDSNLTQSPIDDETEKPCMPQITCQFFRNLLEVEKLIP